MLAMSAEPAKPESVRLFAALDVPESVRARIDAWGARELTDPALRPVTAENLHMTLCFLGRTEVARVSDASAAVRALPSKPVRIRLASRPVGKPARRPSVWALEAAAPAAKTLHSKLAAMFIDAGLLEPERRPFWTHLTVARTRNEPAKRRSQRVLRPPGDLPAELAQPFDAVRVSLYRSDLRSDGAKYVSLTQKNLPPSASSPGGEEGD